MLNPPVNGKIQGLFKAFECFSSTFQGKFNFPRTFEDSAVYSSTFQACANPDKGLNLSKIKVYNHQYCALSPEHAVALSLNILRHSALKDNRLEKQSPFIQGTI